MARRNRVKPLTVPAYSAGMYDDTAAAQELMGAMMHTGAAVASMRKASFSREMRALSVILRMVQPTNRGLKESLK